MGNTVANERVEEGIREIATLFLALARLDVVTEATAAQTHVTLIFNFFDELRRLAPVKR